MKILVTGGLGFIGHNVVAELESLGHECYITDTQTNYGIIPQEEIQFLVAERRKLIQTDRIYGIDIADVSGIDWLIKKHRPDTVIHLASFPRQKVVNINPQWGSKSMSEGLLNLLEASSKNLVNRFVYISSSMVYGDFPSDNVSEETSCYPLGQYGILKLAGEWLTKDYKRRTGMNYTILRPSAVYGPLDVEDRVVSKFLTTVFNRGIIQVNGPKEKLDFTYVTDTARGIAKAATSEAAQNQTYNLSRGSARTLEEAAQLAIQIGKGGSLRFNDSDSSYPSRGQLDISKAQQDFGYAPTVDIEEGFKEYYGWLEHSFYRRQKTVQQSSN